jgi:hypothetical protein
MEVDLRDIIILCFFCFFFILTPKFSIADLIWKQSGVTHNLTEMGILKGIALPLAPDINNGASSTFGGTVSNSPIPENKLLLINYQQYVFYDKLNDDKGSRVHSDFSASVYGTILRMLYASPFTFANNQARILPEISIPVVTSRVDVHGKLFEKTGIGDIKAGVGVFWDNMFSFKQVNFDGLMGADVSFPTGKYKKGHLSIGHNIYDVLLFFETMSEIGLPGNHALFFKNHLQYNYYDKNNDFINPVTLDNNSDYRFGHNIQYNYMLVYKFNEVFGTGVAGFYNQQLAEDEMDGNRIKNSKEKSIGIGPIFTYAAHHIRCSLRTLFVVDSKNSPEGNVTTLIFNFML